MVKNTQSANLQSAAPQVETPKAVQTEKPRRHHVGAWLFGVFVLALMAGGGWVLYQNPQIFNRREVSSAQDEKFKQLEARLGRLQQQINDLAAADNDSSTAQQLADMNEKIDNMSRLNHEILDSKAGTGVVLGLVQRFDNLELKVESLGKVSSRGALILTAAMLVKDSAVAGRPFEYEAEVLRQLAAGTNMETAADTIARYAAEGIMSKKQLKAEFEQIYDRQHVANAAEAEKQAAVAEKEEAPATTEPGWKEKINAKLSELIIIEHHQKEETPKEDVRLTDEVYQLVKRGELDLAAQKMAQNPFYNTEAFAIWRNQVQARDDFAAALRRIQALTLGVMKAENLTNAAQ